MYFILFRTICPSKAHFPLDSFLNFNRTAGQFSHSFLVHPRRRHRDAERIPHLSQIVTQTDSDTPHAGLILLIVQSVALIFHRVQLFQEMFKIRDRLRCPGHDMTILPDVCDLAAAHTGQHGLPHCRTVQRNSAADPRDHLLSLIHISEPTRH